MKKSPLILSLAALAAASVSFAATDGERTVMTVGPEKVSLNEFEYLYNKNNRQQAAATSLDDYIDMFANYKMKVLAAKEAGYDTLQSYRDDLEKYTRELARPYIRTESVDDSLVNVAYDHLLTMVNVDHILIPSNAQGSTPTRQRQLADSIRNAIAAGADFGELAMKHSLDKASARRGGNMGYIVGGMWPYTFEDLVFNTPQGQISEVKQSPYGYHIVRVNDRKPNPGTVKTRHILKSTKDMDEAASHRQKAAIDSLLTLVRGGADFAEVARNNTDEPQGQQSGGDLPWFATGQMVTEFNDAAFALAPGQISDPVKTAFGWHIILCEDRKGVQPLDSMRQTLHDNILKDERGTLAIQRTIDDWKASHHPQINHAELDKINNLFRTSSVAPAELLVALGTSGDPIATLGDDTVTTGYVAKSFRLDPDVKPDKAIETFGNAVNRALDNIAIRQFIAGLPARYPDYRNLLNEYRDGMLLYEISNAEIWDKANTDSIGLQNYYLAHIDDYKWDRPRYKGYILAATTDSLADAAIEYLNAALTDSNTVPTQQNIRKRFGNNVKLERVLAAKGDNAVVDNLCFGAPRPDIKNRWKAYRTFNGRVIDQPEDARDVKGQVSLGYQQQLEEAWLKQLHKRYKVKVDRKALRKALGNR